MGIIRRCSLSPRWLSWYSNSGNHQSSCNFGGECKFWCFSDITPLRGVIIARCDDWLKSQFCHNLSKKLSASSDINYTCFINGVTPVSSTMLVFFIGTFTRTLPLRQQTVPPSLVTTEAEIWKLKASESIKQVLAALGARFYCHFTAVNSLWEISGVRIFIATYVFIT